MKLLLKKKVLYQLYIKIVLLLLQVKHSTQKIPNIFMLTGLFAS